MNGMSAGFFSAFGTLGATACGDTRTSLRMVQPAGGAAQLVFRSADRRRHTAVVSRWLAVVRVSPRGTSATRVMWLLDGTSAAWSGGHPPGELYRGATGLDEEDNPVLWFHARGGGPARAAVPGSGTAGTRRARALRWARGWLRVARAPWAFSVAGVFGAAGIVDGASVRVSKRPISRRAWLWMRVDTGVWELSPERGPDAVAVSAAPGPSLTITADGKLRPLDLEVIRQWL